MEVLHGLARADDGDLAAILAAWKLWKAAKKYLTSFFCKLKKCCFSGGRLWNQPDFPAKLCFGGRLWMQLEPKFSTKFVKMG